MGDELIFQVLESVAARIEVLLRNGTAKLPEKDYESLKEDAYSLYNMFQESGQYSNGVKAMSETERNRLLDLAVKLHNKCRNLSSSHLEVRAILRASCAWMFATFGDRHYRVSIIVMKLMRKSGDDMHLVGNSKYALECWVAASNLWHYIKSTPSIDQLPPLEVQDLKLSIFNCYLGILKTKGQEGDRKNTQEALANLQAAMELLPFVSFTNRIGLAQVLVSIASTFAVSKELQNDAINMYNKCVEILDASKLNDYGESSAEAKYKVNNLRLRCFLSMAYLYISDE